MQIVPPKKLHLIVTWTTYENNSIGFIYIFIQLFTYKLYIFYYVFQGEHCYTAASIAPPLQGPFKFSKLSKLESAYNFSYVTSAL